MRRTAQAQHLLQLNQSIQLSFDGGGGAAAAATQGQVAVLTELLQSTELHSRVRASMLTDLAGRAATAAASVRTSFGVQQQQQQQE